MSRKSGTKFHYIYRISNLITGEYYIGCHSANSLINKYYGSGLRIKSSIKKYGKENFQKEILMVCLSKNNKFLMERLIVNEELLRDPMCLNLREGGMAYELTDEIKRKMSEARKGRYTGQDNPMFGRKQTEEWKQTMSERMSGENNPMCGKKRPDVSESNRTRTNPNLGKSMSEEQKKKIGEANKGERNGMYGKKGEDHPAYGKTPTEKTREKMRKAKIGFIPWNKGLKNI